MRLSIPTIEVAPTTPGTDAYLAHNAIPVQFTSEDFDQVIDGGNFVTKVIYLPDPKYQELAVSGVETLVSTRLEPGVDPILEADKRGTILLIVRLGAIDLEMPGLQGAGMAVTSSPIGNVAPPGSLPPGVAPAGSVILDPNPATVAPVTPAPAPAGAPPIPAPVTPPPVPGAGEIKPKTAGADALAPANPTDPAAAAPAQ